MPRHARRGELILFDHRPNDACCLFPFHHLDPRVPVVGTGLPRNRRCRPPMAGRVAMASIRMTNFACLYPSWRSTRRRSGAPWPTASGWSFMP